MMKMRFETGGEKMCHLVIDLSALLCAGSDVRTKHAQR